MYELIKTFPEQLIKALEIGEGARFNTTFNTPIKNVVVAGLGASGFGGNILAELFREELQVPVVVNKSYFLPAFVDSSTLLVLSSYSGNTEETISCAKQAIEKGLRPICVTSGGKLEAFAKQNNLDLITIPAGFPPRTCLGYSTIQLFFIANHFGLINDSFKASVRNASALLQAEQQTILDDTEFLSAKLARKIIVLYSEDKYESTLLRLKQQINENSKLHCWYNVIPEMNHNELVGWREENDIIAVLIFRADDEYERNTHRILFKKDVIEGISKNVFEIHAKGSNSFEKHFYFIHFGDWLSYHLAVLQGYDPTEIDVLNKLKGHMGAIK